MPRGVSFQIDRHSYEGWSKTAQLQLRSIKSPPSRLVGAVLACHLQIEHYLDHLLRVLSDGELDFEGARLNFDTKVKLLARAGSPLVEMHLLQGVRELNALRNHVAHTLDASDLGTRNSEMRAAVRRAFEKKSLPVPDDPLTTVQVFTALAVAHLLGFIASFDAVRNPANSSALSGEV